MGVCREEGGGGEKEGEEGRGGRRGWVGVGVGVGTALSIPYLSFMPAS